MKKVFLIILGAFFFLFLIGKCSETDEKSASDIKAETEQATRQLEELKKTNAEKAAAIEKANKVPLSKKAAKVKKKHPDWTDEECELVGKNRIWIGMSYSMLVYERGKPNRINTSNYGNGEDYQACWDDFQPSCFYFNESQIIKSYN